MPFVYIKSGAADGDLYAGQPTCSAVARNDNGPAWGWTCEDSVHAELGQKRKATVMPKTCIQLDPTLYRFGYAGPATTCPLGNSQTQATSRAKR